MKQLRFRIPEPYDTEWMLGFLGRRAIEGIESVSGRVYQRYTEAGPVRVEFETASVSVSVPPTLACEAVTRRVRELLDLDADSATIDAHLAEDHRMARRVAARPGLRVPGAWDLYELAVRAILGQQVSVERGTRLVRELVARYGQRTTGSGAVVFPGPAQLASANPAELGLPRKRGDAIRALARAFEAGLIPRAGATPDRVRSTLLGIEGIGAWTAEYVAMRGCRDPDAFPAADWVVRKELDATPAAARRLAEQWRPYRAYAVMYLWAAAARRKGLS